MQLLKSRLIRVEKPDFDVEMDLKYGSNDNFTEKSVYKADAKAFLHVDAAEKLAVAIELAAKMGYRIKIFDAFRPSEAQFALWSHTPDPDFLADPQRGSPHSRGVAIDLTLLDENGKELDMGTEFDAFTPLSHHGNQEISEEAQKNRHILLGIMTDAGWDFYRNEWWHYQLFDSKTYPLLTDEEAGTGMMP